MTRLAAHLTRHWPAFADPRADGDLLAAFLADRDEPAFAELVRRHGPLVWAACRRLLPDAADAEDAFQATFLVLVRRARRLTGQATLAPWLYRVAVWTARNVRRRNARTHARRVPLSPATADPSPGPAINDLRTDLDRALLALPEKYRTPLLLCHLQGWSRRDAAARLGCPEGTLSSLLSRGLARLRAQLRDRDPSQSLVIGMVAVPSLLVSATVKAAAASRLAVAGVISSSVSQLVEGVIHMFWVKKATAASCALFVVFGMGVGVGVSVREGQPMALAGDGPTGPSPKTANGPPSHDARDKLLELNDKFLELNEQLVRERADRKNYSGHAKSLQTLLDEKRELVRQVEDRVNGGTASRASLRQARESLASAQTGVGQELKEWLSLRDKSAVKIKDTEAQIEAVERVLKATGKPPTSPRETGSFSAMVEIDALEGKIEVIRQQEAAVRDQLAALRGQLRDARERYERARGPGRAADRPGRLAVLAVRGVEENVDPESGIYAVFESDLDGKGGGVVICSNLEMLRQTFLRARRDPGRKWQVVFRPTPDELLHRAAGHAFKVAKETGFEGATFEIDRAEAKTAAALARLGWKHPSADKLNIGKTDGKSAP